MNRITQTILITLILSITLPSCSYFKRHDEKKRIFIVESKILNVREHTNTDSKILGKVYLNDTLNPVKVYFDWVGINYNGDTGYVSSRFVKTIRVIDNSLVANMKLDPVSTIIRDEMNYYLNWRKWEFWVGVVIMYLISLGLLALCRNFDDIMDDYYMEEYSSLPYYTGLIGALLSFVFMFWREEVLQTLFIKKMYWLPEDNEWISWYIWSLAAILILFIFMSFISHLVTYRWRGIFRIIYYSLTSLVTFITGMFIGIFIILFIIFYLLISVLSGFTSISEDDLLSKATHDGLGSLSLGEWTFLGKIFRRRGFNKEANIISDILTKR